MKRMFWMTIASVLSLAPAAALAEDTAPEPLALGATAPMADTKLKSVDGKEVAFTDVAGKKGTLVVFTCNHCPWAKMWEERIAALGNAATKKGIGVIAINANDPAAYPEDSYEEMIARAKKLGIKYPYAVDATSDVARAYGAARTPEAFLFDAKGKLVYHGAIDDNAKEPKAVKEAYLRKAVDAVVAGKPVPMAETKAMGCGIKYRKPAEAAN
jgi:peroxiredoxin